MPNSSCRALTPHGTSVRCRTPAQLQRNAQFIVYNCTDSRTHDSVSSARHLYTSAPSRAQSSSGRSWPAWRFGRPQDRDTRRARASLKRSSPTRRPQGWSRLAGGFIVACTTTVHPYSGARRIFSIIRPFSRLAFFCIGHAFFASQLAQSAVVRKSCTCHPPTSGAGQTPSGRRQPIPRHPAQHKQSPFGTAEDRKVEAGQDPAPAAPRYERSGEA